MPTLQVAVRKKRRLFDSYLYHVLIFILCAMRDEKQCMPHVSWRIFHLFLLSQHQKNEYMLKRTFASFSVSRYACYLAGVKPFLFRSLRRGLCLVIFYETMHEKSETKVFENNHRNFTWHILRLPVRFNHLLVRFCNYFSDRTTYDVHRICLPRFKEHCPVYMPE